METESGSLQKNLERRLSQKAIQLSTTASCRVGVFSFLAGVCVTYLLLAAVTSVGKLQLQATELKPTTASGGESLKNRAALTEERGIKAIKRVNELGNDPRVSLLYSAWENLLASDDQASTESSFKGSNTFNVPKAPHLEDCKSVTNFYKQLDMVRPPWPSWQGFLMAGNLSSASATDAKSYAGGMAGTANPPWIVGGDEDNYPATRKVQQDIWLHQHPENCDDPAVRFLVADWEREPGFGIGAQIAGMNGFLAIAIKQKRVLVTNYFNRADHEGCLKGSGRRAHWSCYFFPETSPRCRERALELMGTEDARWNGSVTTNANYTSKEIWSGKVPTTWGTPWEGMQPTTEIDGRLLMSHRKMDRRWWRAQAVRYLMRFKSEYTCELLNVARHEAFGMQAAQMVLDVMSKDWPREESGDPQTDLERYVWSSWKPWVPRPLLSIHVRMGDKAIEMKVASFDTYMQLAARIRRRFPDLKHIWLSTEMQDVIDKIKLYSDWKFYYTQNVARQVGNTSMADYERSLGRKTSTNYPIVNFLMAIDADFSIGALGSTWCYLTDGMRNTGGKVMGGYISVNRDRFW